MSQAGFVVDPFAFARDGRRLAQEFVLADLARIAAEAVSSEGQFDVVVTGTRDRDGNSFLELRIEGSTQLRCQRCLEPMAWTCSIRSLLMLVRPGRPVPEDELEDDSYDAIEVGERQDLVALIEDEILLALPIAPRHEVCVPPLAEGGSTDDSPFAGLAGLRSDKGSK